jgi:hypothetical protein
MSFCASRSAINSTRSQLPWFTECLREKRTANTTATMFVSIDHFVTSWQQQRNPRTLLCVAVLPARARAGSWNTSPVAQLSLQSWHKLSMICAADIKHWSETFPRPDSLASSDLVAGGMLAAFRDIPSLA